MSYERTRRMMLIMRRTIGGVGLLGGVLIGEAIESHDDYEYDQGFQDGECLLDLRCVVLTFCRRI